MKRKKDPLAVLSDPSRFPASSNSPPPLAITGKSSAMTTKQDGRRSPFGLREDTKCREAGEQGRVARNWPMSVCLPLRRFVKFFFFVPRASCAVSSDLGSVLCYAAIDGAVFLRSFVLAIINETVSFFLSSGALGCGRTSLALHFRWSDGDF